MKNNPLVTVYITNFNYAKYLNKSIQSVLSQSYQDFELLIIDDGSTDNSKDIISNYEKYENIKTIFQKNKGLNATNNIAIRTALGKYIMRLDADDYLHRDALKLMVEKLESDDELGLIFPDYYYIDSEGFIIGEERRYDFEKEVSLFDLPAHGACTMIRLSFLKEVGGYNESFSCQDGYDLWIKFINKYKVANITIPLFYYRRHETNLTNNETRILQTREKIKDTFLKKYNKQTPTTTIMIPVRSKWISGSNWPLYPYKGKTVLEHKVEVSLSASKISHVIIVSSEEEILNYTKEKYKDNPNVSIVKRPNEYSEINESLNKTFQLVLQYLKEKHIESEAIMSVSLEYPFLEPNTIDDAINTMVIFNTDTVLSVRTSNQIHYKHTGHTLEPILNQADFTKLEREVLYSACGGIILTKINSFEKHKRMINGRIGHIIVDTKTAFRVSNEFELSIFNHLKNHES